MFLVFMGIILLTAVLMSIIIASDKTMDAADRDEETEYKFIDMMDDMDEDDDFFG